MKTISELFQLVAVAVETNGGPMEEKSDTHWFIDFSGHVNKMGLRFYSNGWKGADSHCERITETMTPEGIQSLYWFIYNRLPQRFRPVSEQEVIARKMRETLKVN